jgi:hypothetical protein
MRYHWGRRATAAVLAAMVALSSVNTQAIAEVTGADAGAALEAAAGALTGGAAGEATATTAADAEKSNEVRQLSFVGAGVRVFKDGVELGSLVEVYEQDEITLMLAAKQGYALGETATLVTNVEDPVITQFSVVDGTVVIPAGTLTTDGTLNLTATLTGEPVEEEAATAASEAEESGEASEDEDLTVSLEDLTNAQVAGESDEAASEASEESVEGIGGADALRYTLESSSIDVTATAVGNELAAAASELEAQGAGSTVAVDFMTAEADVENPAFEGYAYVDGAVIKVTAAEGVLPEGTCVEAKAVEDEKYAAAVNEAMGDVLGTYVAYDITLYDVEGNEVQPTEAVNVAIFDAFAGEDEDATPAVFHVNDDATEVQIVTARQLDAEVQSFDVEHFSVYLVGYENITSYYPSGTGDSFDNRITVIGEDKNGNKATYSLVIACTEDHEHNFWTDNKYWTKASNGTLTSGTPQAGLEQFNIEKWGELWGTYYCVVKTNNKGIYTGKPQILYCGPSDNADQCSKTYINNVKNSTIQVNGSIARSIFAIDVETDHVKIGASNIASNLASREVAPLFDNLTYSFTSLAQSSNFYYFVGPEEGYLLNYWDSYYILWTQYYDYTIRDVFDYSNFPTINISGDTSKIGRSTATVAINNDAGTTASSRGYVAYGTGNNRYLGWMQQKYYRIKAKAEKPTEDINANNTVDKNVELKPGDRVTFNVTVDPYNLDLTTDQNSTATVLTKTSTVSVKTEDNTSQDDVITTSTAGVALNKSTSTYTTTTLYTTQDTGETHEHSFDYVITRADCVAALKRANKNYPSSTEAGYNTASTYEVILDTSVTTDYEAKLKTNGGYLTTTASNTVELGTTIGTVSKEHYVYYNLTYKYAPTGVATSEYPKEIQSVSDVNTEDGGKGNKTPFWQGETVSFAGYSVGQIVEDKDLQGYWVFSGWKDNNGNYLTSDITMGTSDITVTGEWTFVSYEVHYEMEASWEYDGTFHPAIKSYVGTEATHVDSTPNHYTFYQQVEGEGGTTEWQNIGSEQPVNAGTYKVEATWDYIITNEEKIAENEKNNAAGSGDAENSGEAASAVDGESVGDEGSTEDGDGTTEETPATKPANEGTITKTCEFTITKVDVNIESASDAKYYDGYPLTASKLTMTGGWIASEAPKIAVVATGEQTLPNDGTGEERTPNTIVILPALEDAEETPALALARAKAYAEAVASRGEDYELTEDEAAFEALLSNYNITRNTGTLTVQHRITNKLELALVGTTPAEALTYNGKEQEVSGYTVNGTASKLDESGAQVATFDMDAQTGHEGTDAAAQATWTLTGATATGSGKNASSSAYTVALDASNAVITDAAGNVVTSEFTWTTKDGSFTIAPVKLTIESDSVSRAYDTTTLTAHSYTITEGSFVRGEGLVDARITWGGSIRRVGSVKNTINIDNAWSGTTQSSNYEVTLVEGTLTVLASVDVSERMDITVNAKSKQVEEQKGVTQSLSGFTSESGGYVTYTVESGEGESVLYIEGLSASGSGSTPGKYPVTVSGLDNLRIYDSNGTDKIDVTECFNVTAYNGYLTIRAEGSSAVEFSNRSELQGKTYDGKSLVPVAEGLQDGTTVFYTTEKSVADKAEALPGATNELGELIGNGVETGKEADALADGWSTKAPEFTDAGTFTVYAMGYKDGKFTPVESVDGTINTRKVTLTSDSAVKAYDGVTLTAATMPRPAASSLGWVAADLSKLEITATGSQKAPGESENTIEVVAAGTYATQQEAQDALDAVLKNYTLVKTPGELQVTALAEDARIELAVVGSTGTTLEYNGLEQEVTGFTINGVASTVNEEDGTVSTVLLVTNSEGEEVGTWTVTGVSALGSGKDVKVAPEAGGDSDGDAAAFDATYPVLVTVGALKVVDEDGTDVSAQFAASTAAGSFEITKKTVVIASKSASKTYDLQPLTYQYYRITSGEFVEDEGLNEAAIEWTGTRTSPGSAANTFSIDNAWAEGTNPNNYAVTLATGTLTVKHITNDDDKFEVVVKSKSDKQRLTTEGTAVTLSGFESSITVNGKTYIPVSVTRNGFSATLYVTNLRASVTAKERGTYTNSISGTPVVYDSLDPETRSNVADSIKVQQIAGVLRLLGPLDDALEWTNENDVYELDEETGEAKLTKAGIDGTYYDGAARTPEVVSKFYSGVDSSGQALSTIYYTTDADAAQAAEKDVKSINLSEAAAADDEAGADGVTTYTWSTKVPTFTNAGEHTFYAVGVRSTSIDSDGDDGDSDRVVGDKRYTEVETFTLTILKRTVTLSTEGATKTYDGKAIEIPQDVTVSKGASGFVGTDAEQLDISVEQEEFILPGNYFATINVSEKAAAGEGEAESGDASEGEPAVLAEDTVEDGNTTGILSNYQIIKYPGQLDIDTRVGDERFDLALDFPEMTYTWAGTNFYGGKLVAVSEYGENKDVEQVLSEKSAASATTLVKNNAYIELENGVTFELNGYYAQFTIKNAGTFDYAQYASNILDTGSIYQVKKVTGDDGTQSWERVGSAAVTTNFAQTLNVEKLIVEQGDGNVITSVSSWLDDAENESSSYRAAALTAWYNLNEWSTWTYTGTSAATIPAITAVLGVGTTYYALDATEDGEVEELDEDGNVVVAATNTWYTWDQMKDLLVKPGTYTLSFKNTTTSYKDCFAYDALTVTILERSIVVGEDGVTVYDPTSSDYGFVWDDNGNLLDASDKVVANRDGVPTTGANIEGLPVGPAVIMDPQVTYTGEPQQVKPVVVDDQGRLMVEGIHYTLSYEGDITNVGTAAVRITSIPGSGYNCDFTASFEIVASEYGSLKAAEKYTYVYAGGNDLAEPGIIANYGDSKVVYSLNGEEYETWAEVVEAMVNVGSYTLAIKTDGENYVTKEGTVVVEVQPLDMSATPQESIESVEVEAEDLAANNIYVAGGDYTYSGEAYEPEVLIIDEYGNQLVYGRDYTTSVVTIEGRSKAAARAVDEAIDAGSYALAVAYRGNYTGTSYVAFSIEKIAGNEVEGVDVSGVNGGTEGSLEAPAVSTTQDGSNFLYSVDGGAFVSWAEASKLLTAGTHTLAVKATHANYQDVVSDTYTVTIAARPASDTGSSDAATGTVAGSTGTGGSSSTGSSAGGSSSSGRTVQAAGSTTSSNAVSTSTETPTEAVSVESTASNAASSTSSSSTTPEAQAAVTHATYMYLTVTIVTGMLLTAAYSLAVIKQRMNEAERLIA